MTTPNLPPDSALERINQNAPLQAAFHEPVAAHEFTVNHRNRYVVKLARWLKIQAKYPNLKKKYSRFNRD